MKAALIVVLTIGFCIGAIVARRPSANESAKTAISAWCRLAELPSGSQRSEVLLAGGSAFTRELEISFQLEWRDLRRWISDSPGLLDAIVLTNGRVETYRVEPKDAQYCLVEIDQSTGEVWIKAYWS